MSKTAISQYSSTPSSNSDVDGIDISEGCPASNLNNAQRSLMSHLKEMDDGTSALTSPSMGQLNVDNLRLDGNTISSTDTNGNVQIDPAGTGVVDVVGTLQSDGLTVDGDVTLNDGSPNLRLKDTDTNRFVDLLYGTRVATFRNTMASGEDMDTVEPSMVFSFKDDGETRTAMTIDHDGKVGIGTSSPAQLMHVNNSSGDAAVQIQGNTRSFKIEQNNYGLRICDVSAGSAERFRIDAAGQLLVATSTSGGNGYTFDASGFLTHARASGGAQSMVGYKNGGNFVGEIRTSTTATSYITSSDYRLKENVTYDWDATTRLKQLKPARFNFIADADTTVDGFLAHEAQTVVPEAVTGTKDAMRDEEYEITPAVLDDNGNEVTPAEMGTRSVPDYQGIDQSKLVPLLVKTIQELEARITALEAE